MAEGAQRDLGRAGEPPLSVVDASVWVSALVSSDVHHAASRAWLEREDEAAGVLVAPALLLPEVASAVSRATRSPLLGRRAIRSLLAVPALRVVPLDGALAELAARLAADHGLRGADAVYVAVAKQLSLPLVTWDREQARRAARVVHAGAPRNATGG